MGRGGRWGGIDGRKKERKAGEGEERGRKEEESIPKLVLVVILSVMVGCTGGRSVVHCNNCSNCEQKSKGTGSFFEFFSREAKRYALL